MVMSPIVVALGLVFTPLCWAERNHELSVLGNDDLVNDLVNDVTMGAKAGANILADGSPNLEGSNGAANSVRDVAGKMYPDAAQHEHMSFTKEHKLGEKAMEKPQSVSNLETKQEEHMQATHSAEFETGLGKEPTGSNTKETNTSFAEGASSELATLHTAAPGDVFLNFIEWWSSNAVQPVSVQWSPVGEAKATTYRCGKRVINLAQTSKEVAEKMMQLTNELGFLFVSLPPATRIANGLLKEMVKQDGLIDKLEKGNLESLAGVGNYAEAASYAKMMYNEVQKQKAALNLPLMYGDSITKTVQQIGTLVGVPPPGPSPPVLEQIRGMSEEGQAALATAQPHLARLQMVVSALRMPALGVEIGNVNGELGKLEVQFMHAERHAKKLQQKTTPGLWQHGLGVVVDTISGSGLSPENSIRQQLAQIGKDMAIYTRNLLRMYHDFESKLAAYNDQFVRSVNSVLETFEQLGVQVRQLFNELASAQLDSAQQMLSSTCNCVRI